MRKDIFFVYTDKYANSRQSDGGEMCIIPKFNDGHIYFYCSEYASFWHSVEELGMLDKAIDFSTKLDYRPATYIEICDANLHRYITSIKVYEGYGKTLKISYVHIQNMSH